MLRYATISSLNCVRNLCGNTVRGHLLKSKPKVIQSDSTHRYLSTLPGSKLTAAASLDFTDAIENTVTTIVKGKLILQTEFPVPKTKYFPSGRYSWGDLSDSEQELIPVDLRMNEIAGTFASNGEPTLVSLGLGGWSPQGIAQQCLEYLHCDQQGMLWVVAIIYGTGWICRFIYRRTNKTHFKGVILDQSLQIIKLKQWKEIQLGHHLEAAKYDEDINRIIRKKKKNDSFIKIDIIFTGLLGYGLSRGVLEMAYLPVESMKTGGMLWFPDLTIPDSYFILPLAVGGVLLLTRALESKRPHSTSNKVTVYRGPGPKSIIASTFALMHLPAAFVLCWIPCTLLGLNDAILHRLESVNWLTSTKNQLEILQGYNASSKLFVTFFGILIVLTLLFSFVFIFKTLLYFILHKFTSICLFLIIKCIIFSIYVSPLSVLTFALSIFLVLGVLYFINGLLQCGGTKQHESRKLYKY